MEKLTLTHVGNALMLRYVGEITLEITGDLKRRLDAELDGNSVGTVVIDLSDVTFMDSSGIGFLVSVNTRMRSAGRSFYLYRLSKPVEKTLGLVQLLQFFQILADETALAAVCA
ncbi:anti-sigma-factor antagonist [Solidesulfovibrio fructosivorans JJ]]|uniref:Anti-sigma factor antagonist n=1 Tax=Solidesulfovibrio fructosivorans JJ] TaxID=596151 RepID=E1K0M6_SOLFR|nr:STAS domain-containing protein [Solidesulfovibrio fructosivorans]EFL49878.1 anti-sigma-factor antagonist [Solidesulfovibrio fructosivorans JJ]]